MRNAYFLILGILFLSLFESCSLDSLDDSTIISGTITDSLGVRLSGVVVKVESTSDNKSVETASDGTYSLSISSGGTADIAFVKEGYTSVKKYISFIAGDRKTINLKMATLAEDAFLTVELKEITVNNKRGSILVPVATNIHYDVVCDQDWITVDKWMGSFAIEYIENLTSVERVATIRLNGEYGLVHEIKITQAAGSSLALLNYMGKDGKTEFLITEVFLPLFTRVA